MRTEQEINALQGLLVWFILSGQHLKLDDGNKRYVEAITATIEWIKGDTTTPVSSLIEDMERIKELSK